MDLARLLPLGDPRKRHDLAQGMFDRGLREEAMAQWELIVRTGPLRDWHTTNAAKMRGNAVRQQQPHGAADAWQRQAFIVLKTSSAFLELNAYLRIPHLIHKMRARGFIKEGKLDAAVRELELARQALPGDMRLAETMVPELDKAGRRQAADELLEKVCERVQHVCDLFPESAGHHNNLAWGSAKCGRRLDEAFEHARQAVRLAPENAAYLDTLAEVHFQRGDRDEAIRLIRRCIEMEPENQHFREQLVRFRAALSGTSGAESGYG